MANAGETRKARMGDGKTATESSLSVLSAFAGAGGLDLGLEAAGFRTIACIERDPDARKTLRSNRPWTLLEPGDIVDVAPTLTPATLGLERRELAMIAAGPPCQPFSKAAQWSHKGRAGLADPRSACLRQLLDLMDTFLPRVLLIENVVGFARGSQAALAMITEALADINRREGTHYELRDTVLDAVRYGVPQRRTRAILVAVRDGTQLEWPEATHTAHPTRAWDALADMRDEEKPEAVGQWAALLPSIPEGWNYLWHTDRGGGKPLFGYRRRYWSFLLKLAKAEPGWTISAHPGPATGPFHWENRPLSVREMLRLQSFPRSWRVSGEYRAQVRQIGNATPPLLAEVIGRSIGEQVFGLSYDERPQYWVARKRLVPDPAPVAGVPLEFLKHVGDHPAHPGTGQGPKPVTSIEGLAA